MRKYCSQCGKRLDSDTGLCPKCDKDKILGAGKKKITFRVGLATVVVICVACVVLYPKENSSAAHILHTHTREDATCTDPATCKDCGTTKGDAKGHSVGDTITTKDNGPSKDVKKE